MKVFKKKKKAPYNIEQLDFYGILILGLGVDS